MIPTIVIMRDLGHFDRPHKPRSDFKERDFSNLKMNQLQKANHERTLERVYLAVASGLQKSAHISKAAFLSPEHTQKCLRILCESGRIVKLNPKAKQGFLYQVAE